MKYNLGSSPTIAPMSGESRQWFPSITIKKKTDVGLKVGQKRCVGLGYLVAGVAVVAQVALRMTAGCRR